MMSLKLSGNTVRCLTDIIPINSRVYMGTDPSHLVEKLFKTKQWFVTRPKVKVALTLESLTISAQKHKIYSCVVCGVTVLKVNVNKQLVNILWQISKPFHFQTWLLINILSAFFSILISLHPGVVLWQLLLTTDNNFICSHFNHYR